MTPRTLPACLAGCALAAASSVAHAALDAPMDMSYAWNDREAPEVVYQDTCAVHVVPVQDARQNRETIGAYIGGALIAGPAAPWVQDGLMQLGKFGFKVDQAEGTARPAAGVTVRTSLTRAYTWQIGLKLFSMVALKAQFVGPDGLIQEKRYRAHGDKTNMWGAASEYLTTMNYGLNNLLPVMAKDLVALCHGSKVDPYSYAGPTPAPASR